MGKIQKEDVLGSGTVFGVYLARNYRVPNIKKLTETAKFMAEEIEERYRKPKRQDGDDNSFV